MTIVADSSFVLSIALIFSSLQNTSDTFLQIAENVVEGDSSVVLKRFAFGTPY